MTLADAIVPRPILSSTLLHKGHIFDLVREEVDLGEGGVVSRDFIDHPGAVAVVVLDDQDRILLLRQYRHPVRSDLWEVPAGLLDIAGEPAHIGAARELHEEADLIADQWHVLTDYLTTPGGNNEAIRVFLARGLHDVPEAEQHVREHEEIGMQKQWISIDEAVPLVLSGQIHNPSAVIGILAVFAARGLGWSTLRDVSADFKYRRTAPLHS